MAGFYTTIRYFVFTLLFFSCARQANKESDNLTPQGKFSAKLVPAEKFLFNSFVDCNMAEAWVADTFRIFPGKYGEDPLWGDARDLKFADGRNAEEAFLQPSTAFKEPVMPNNVPPGVEGLHGAVWFETVYQDKKDPEGKTLFAVYHNENYPQTLPYDSATSTGYINNNWPEGLTGSNTPAAVCRIEIMKSTNGGHRWENKGLFIEDKQPRLIMKPHNTSVTFAGGVGDPSAVASGDHLYLFYSEYGYPGEYDPSSYDPDEEWAGQCISVARISLSDLEQPQGKAKRWDGTSFSAAWDGVGKPITNITIPKEEGGGPASSPTSQYHWGPSVSWNSYLNAWVMLMAKAEGPKWQGGTIYISFNGNRELGEGDNSQQWTRPVKLVDRPGHILWYPSVQPMNTPEDLANKHTSLNLGRRARLFFKDQFEDKSEYLSEFIIEFQRNETLAK
jgi:hypothetical protein